MEIWDIILIVLIILAILAAIIVASIYHKKCTTKYGKADSDSIIDENTFKTMMQTHLYLNGKTGPDVLDPSVISVYIDEFMDSPRRDNPLQHLKDKLRSKYNVKCDINDTKIELSAAEKSAFPDMTLRLHPVLDIMHNDNNIYISVDYINDHIQYNIMINDTNIGQRALSEIDELITFISDFFRLTDDSESKTNITEAIKMINAAFPSLKVNYNGHDSAKITGAKNFILYGLNTPKPTSAKYEIEYSDSEFDHISNLESLKNVIQTHLQQPTIPNTSPITQYVPVCDPSCCGSVSTSRSVSRHNMGMCNIL
jgi:hypothetical protein